MKKSIDDQKVIQQVKGISIFLVIIAVFAFFIGSSKIFHFSETNPVMYEINYSHLSNILGPTRGNGHGGSKFFDEVSKKRRK